MKNPGAHLKDIAGLRVAFFLPSLRGGGAERVTINLTRGLAERSLQLDLVVADATGEYQTQVPQQVRLVDLKSRRVLSGLPGLIRYLRRSQPAVLIGAMDHANLVALLAKMFARVNTRLILTIHKDHQAYLADRPTFKERLILRLFRYLQGGADAVVAVSGGAAQSAAHTMGVQASTIHVIYNPVVTPELVEKASAPVTHHWLTEEQTPVILGVGRLDRFKDFHTLVQAFALVRKTRSAHLLILGEGQERDSLERLVQELNLQGDVQMPGFVQNPFAYMARAGVFVLSSQSEALPTVLIEAMACGCPVVSTNCPSGPAEILANGAYGILVPVGDAGAMADAILKTLEQHHDPAKLRARANDFSLAKIVDQYLTLVTDIVR